MNTKSEWRYWIASITDNCQNRCPGCYRVLQNNLLKNGGNNGFMSLQSFRKILRIFVEQGGQSIDFVGGEPTLHPDFLKMVQLCAQAGIKIWIYTNLREFGKDIELAKQILETGGEITVVGKLNVPNPTISKQRKFQAKLIGASEKAVDEMWSGLSMLSMFFAESAKGRIGVENLLRKENIELAPKVYELGLQMGFFVDLEIPTCPVGVTKEAFLQWLNLFPTREQILSCIAEVAKINARYGVKPFIPIMPHLSGRNAEGMGMGCIDFKQSALLTEADGRLGLCTSGKPLLDADDKPLNIFHDSLEVVLKNSALIERRMACQQENIKSGPCAICQFWQFCLGGCSALRESFGFIFDSYPLCYMHEWPSQKELLSLFLDNKKRGIENE